MEQVDEAIARNLDHPDFFPQRQVIGKVSGQSLLGQLSTSLQTYAPQFEAPDAPEY